MHAVSCRVLLSHAGISGSVSRWNILHDIRCNIVNGLHRLWLSQLCPCGLHILQRVLSQCLLPNSRISDPLSSRHVHHRPRQHRIRLHALQQWVLLTSPRELVLRLPTGVFLSHTVNPHRLPRWHRVFYHISHIPQCLQWLSCGGVCCCWLAVLPVVPCGVLLPVVCTDASMSRGHCVHCHRRSVAQCLHALPKRLLCSAWWHQLRTLQCGLLLHVWCVCFLPAGFIQPESERRIPVELPGLSTRERLPHRCDCYSMPQRTHQ